MMPDSLDAKRCTIHRAYGPVLSLHHTSGKKEVPFLSHCFLWKQKHFLYGRMAWISLETCKKKKNVFKDF